MATSFDVIFDRFYKKLVNDKSFFNYKGLTEEEIKELVRDHSVSLLEQAIDYLYSFGKPEVDFYDRDDTQFNFDLTPQEIGLLADIQYYMRMLEERNKLKVMALTFKSSELNLFSPASERREFENMLKEIQKDVDAKIINYLSRDRDSWNYKSVYETSGDV